jgi:hypothetical protein
VQNNEQRRDCQSCNSCLQLLPSFSDMYEERMEVRLYCLDERAIYTVNGQRFPSLTSRVRRWGCGPKGDWWTPFFEVHTKLQPERPQSSPTKASGTRKFYHKEKA